MLYLCVGTERAELTCYGASEIIISLEEGEGPILEVETVTLSLPGGVENHYKLKAFTYCVDGHYVAYVGFAEQACPPEEESSRLVWLKFDDQKISRIEAGVAYHRARMGVHFVYSFLDKCESIKSFMKEVVDEERKVVSNHARDLLTAMLYIVDFGPIATKRPELCKRFVATNWGLKTDFSSEETVLELMGYVEETHCSTAMFGLHENDRFRGKAMQDAVRLRNAHMDGILPEKSDSALFVDIWPELSKRLFGLENTSELLPLLRPTENFVQRFLTYPGMRRLQCVKCNNVVNNKFLAQDCGGRAILCLDCIEKINRAGFFVCPVCKKDREGGYYYHNDRKHRWIRRYCRWFGDGAPIRGEPNQTPRGVPEPEAAQMSKRKKHNERKRARPSGGDRGGSRLRTQRTRSSAPVDHDRDRDDNDDEVCDDISHLDKSASSNHGTG